MVVSEVSIKFEGPDSGEMVTTLLDASEYAEVEIHGMTGAEGDVAWIVAAILGSPVVVKVLDVLGKMHGRGKIGKVTISKDGKVLIENATADEAAKVLQALNKNKK